MSPWYYQPLGHLPDNTLAQHVQVLFEKGKPQDYVFSVITVSRVFSPLSLSRERTLPGISIQNGITPFLADMVPEQGHVIDLEVSSYHTGRQTAPSVNVRFRWARGTKPKS